MFPKHAPSVHPLHLTQFEDLYNMEGVQSQLGYYPKCPHCESDQGFDMAVCGHTTGISGYVELLSCKSCKKLIQAFYPYRKPDNG
jgi:phage terminase large subunit GpA-like protein